MGTLYNESAANISVSVINGIAEGCVECHLCISECALLAQYGPPGRICQAFLSGNDRLSRSSVFGCTLCGLCNTVCPKDLDCSSAFLAIRKEYQHTADNGRRSRSLYREHDRLCTYEGWGRSSLLTLHQIAKGSRAVFFPGCALAATRAGVTHSLYTSLKNIDPSMGIVLDCCGKPSHDLGLKNRFEDSFTRLTDLLRRHNIEILYTACPSCYITFNTHTDDFTTVSVYELLADHSPGPDTAPALSSPNKAAVSETVAVHDTCSTRNVPAIQDAVRKLVASTGADLVEMNHHRSTALCCGEGAAAAYVAPEITLSWRQKRKQEASGRRIITYCAGCSETLNKDINQTHILDLLYDPERAVAGREKVAKSPFTYLDRLLLKRRLLRSAGSTSATSLQSQPTSRRFLRWCRGITVLLFFIFLAAHFMGAAEPLSHHAIERLFFAMNGCPPPIYIAIFGLAQLLLLPASPFVAAAGVLYGQVWGVFYAMTGATFGAALAFLASRYLSAGFFQSQLNAPPWLRLRERVERHGWKAVAFTRLVPVFPFTLVNYAFGLTKVPFSHYLVATILCILPGCVAFVVFSSSLPDLIQGHISAEFWVGLTCLLTVLMLPRLYNHFKRKR